MLQQLTKETELEEVLKSPVMTWLFKHSNTCGVSSAAYDEVNNFLNSRCDGISQIIIGVEQNCCRIQRHQQRMK